MNWITSGLLLLVTATVLVQASENGHKTRNKNGTKRGGNGKSGRTTSTTEIPVDIHQQDEPNNPDGQETCEVARLKCAYRVGCGMALQNYMVGCSDVITGASQRCSDHCRNSLIALTSTDEGEALMKCKCGDSFCKDAKQRIDICRTAVLRATHNSTTVSCSVAQWICAADPLCSTALEYYNRFCRSMFAGKKCILRCKNSISILRRQEKAAKLSTCVCDGSEDYDCPSILDNMDRLCYHKVRPAAGSTTDSPVIASTSHAKESQHHHNHHKVNSSKMRNPHQQQTTVLGGGSGVEEHTNNENINSINNSSDLHQSRTGHDGHQSGHQPHHPRPHHPHHPHVTEGIDNNEIEPRQPSTSVRPEPTDPSHTAGSSTTTNRARMATSLVVFLAVIPLAVNLLAFQRAY